MSNSDSFINEVTEELRRDRMMAALRKYGWIGLVLVALIVGGTAWREYQASAARASAQGFGDALQEALDGGDEAARLAALQGISASADQEIVKTLVLTSDPSAPREAAVAALKTLIDRPDLPIVYHDLALLRLILIEGKDRPLDQRKADLATLGAAGRPFAPLAQEQLALIALDEGKRDEAIASLSALIEAQESPQSLRGRASAMLEALGVTPPAAPAAPAPASGAAEGEPSSGG